MKNNKVIPESLVLPNPAFISDVGIRYIRNITKLSKQAYDSAQNFTIKYGQDERESIDIFVPDKIDKLLPVLLFFHGGYWLNGSKEIMGYLARNILTIPMIFVTVGYRLAPKYKFPVALSDAKKAIVQVIKKIEKYGGNKSSLVISGHSAGGQIAVSLVLGKYLKDIIPESYIKLCAPISGVFNIYECPDFVKSNFIKNEDDYLKASPLYWDIKSNTPVKNCKVPFLLTSSGFDFPNIKRDHELMLAKMKYYNYNVESLIEPNKNHFTLSLSLAKSNSQWLKIVKKFLD